MAQSLWKFGGLTPLRLARRVGREFNEDDILGRSAELSYYFLLALFPLLLFMVNMVGLFAGQGTELRESLQAALGKVLPPAAGGLIQQTLDEVVKSSGGFKALLGLLGALWAASAGLRAMSNTLNVAYEVQETRPFLKRVAISVGLTVALSLLILSALGLMLYGERLAEFVAAKLGMSGVFTLAWKVLQWPLIAAAMLGAFALVYYFAPNLKEPKWYYVTPGAVTGLALWLLSSFAFRLYLQYFDNYSATYGSLGAVIILMLWFYLTGIAILVGGEVNSEITIAEKEELEYQSKLRSINAHLAA